MNKLLNIKLLINREHGELIFSELSKFPQFFENAYFINFVIFADPQELDRLLDKQTQFSYSFFGAIISSWLQEIKHANLPKELRDFYQLLTQVTLNIQSF